MRRSERCVMLKPIAAMIALLFASSATAAEPAPLTRASVGTMTSRELALRLLPGAIARTIDAHEVYPPIFPGGPLGVIRLYARAERATPTVCRRRSHYVAFTPVAGLNAGTSRQDAPSIAGSVTPGVLIALAANCARNLPDNFARVQPASQEQGAIAVLERLAFLQSRARRARQPRVGLLCRDAMATDACNRGATSVLARLPLQKVHIIDRGFEPTDKQWRLSIMPTGPGQLYWETVLDADPASPGVTMTWKAPAPF